ncbi:hypothetical protein C8R45DRAFT_1073037 [Mycena sanguinolenta]|nr:hypothetical protein C8R45DRAFT_1073037 [Mycena sanguinolenta]
MGPIVELNTFFERNGSIPAAIQFVECSHHLVERWRLCQQRAWPHSIIKVKQMVFTSWYTGGGGGSLAVVVVVADGIPGTAAVDVVYADPSRDKLVHTPPECQIILQLRAQVKPMLSSNNSLNLNRYLHLILLAGTNICLAILLRIWVLWVNVKVVPGVIWRSDVYDVASLRDDPLAHRHGFAAVLRVLWLCGRGNEELPLGIQWCRERRGILNRDNVIRPVELDWSADASVGTLTYLDVEKSQGSATSFVDLSMGIIPDYKEEADSSDPSDSDLSDSGSSLCAMAHIHCQVPSNDSTTSSLIAAW